LSDDAEILAAAADTGGEADAEVSGAAVKRIIVGGETEGVTVEVALSVEVADADDTVEGVGCPWAKMLDNMLEASCGEIVRVVTGSVVSVGVTVTVKVTVSGPVDVAGKSGAGVVAEG